MHGLLLCMVALLAALATPDPRPPSIAEFQPASHGFRFVNHFEGSPSPVPLGGLDNRLGVPTTYGLCGGMSFAAADFFLLRRQVPPADQPPAPGSPLFRYIQSRQTDSLGPRMSLIASFGRWMSAPDNSLLGTRFATLEELHNVRQDLDRGLPVVLGLVYVRYANNRGSNGPAGSAWNNHQVLAIGHSRDRDETVINVYDPNFPGRGDAAIHCTPMIVGVLNAGLSDGVPTPILGIRCVQKLGGRTQRVVRGLIPMPYQPKVPPEGL